MTRIFRIITILWISVILMSPGWAAAPQEVKLEKASYRKLTISWQSPDVISQVAHYKIFRNGSEIATTAENHYIDTAVQPGTSYIYKVQAIFVGGGASDHSAELPVKTLTTIPIENSPMVETVVDAFHGTSSSNLTAVSLFSAVKSGLEAVLGSSLSFSVVDESILTQSIARELAFINSVMPPQTEAERLAVQAELNDFLNNSFCGNPFDHVMIHAKLTELAEAHWAAGNVTAAKMFYEASLIFLTNHEPSVYNALNRKAVFAKAHINSNSSEAEIFSSLNEAQQELNRFFDFFPNSNHLVFVRNVRLFPPKWFFSYFPKLLDYANYDPLYFSQARILAQAAVDSFPNDSHANKLFQKISAWELVNLQVRFLDENGNPRSGVIRVINTSAENGKQDLFPHGAYSDEREFALINGTAVVPVYIGHEYGARIQMDVAGGAPLLFSVPQFIFGKDIASSYSYLDQNTSQGNSAQPRVDFIVPSSAYPYNLRAERGIDVFDLTWDWVAPANFNTAYFKILRGSEEIATSLSQTVRLPLNNTANQFQYQVIAYDSNGIPSVASQAITVYPGDQSQYGDFYVWMAQYFGEQPIYASDDPDGDGVDNYHEFLNGTDPTKQPGPTPDILLRGFNKLTIGWEAANNSENVQYQISRNGTVIGVTSDIRFADSGLCPGASYVYKVKILSPGDFATDWSLPNTLTTQNAHTYPNADKVQQIVDSFLQLDILGYTGNNLVSAVKSGLEAITGTAITFTVINRELLEDTVNQELALLNEVTPSMTAAERIAAKNELNTMMEQAWGGHSFEEMYINAQLTSLAEKHWKEYLKDRTKLSSRQAAIELFEASLLFLSDHPVTVQNTLLRLSSLYLYSINNQSSDAEIKNALAQARDTLFRISNYLDENKIPATGNPYQWSIRNYQKYFRRFLRYEQYDYEFFAAVLQLASAYQIQDPADNKRKALLDDISAWQLTNLIVDCGATSGVLSVRNTISLPPLPGEMGAIEDCRTFPLTGSPVNIPVYAGHTYDITVSIAVPDGPNWVRTIAGLKFGRNRRITDDPFAGQNTESWVNDNGDSQLALPVGVGRFPYNLSSEQQNDTFSLSWEFTPPAGVVIDHYNIYRGDTLVASSVVKSCANLPNAVCENGVYTYTVTAVDAAGFESPRSPFILVLPNFTAEEEKYFKWKRNYFGDTPSLATDDPDQDGLTNYQEYLLGSNPTLAPSSNPKENVSNIYSGGVVKYYSGIFTSYPDFTSLEPYKTEIIQAVNQTGTEGEVLTSGRASGVALSISGYFDITQAGLYRFYLAANGGAELSLDKSVLLNFRSGGSNERYVDIYLTQGTHYLELGYFKKATKAELRLSWAGPNFSRTVFGSTLWHTANDESILTETIYWQKDSDLDRIPDREERALGTDPFNADTDGDGLSDYEEIYVLFTNPLIADTDGDGQSDYEEAKFALSNPLLSDFSGGRTVYQTINGSNYTAASPGWSSNGTDMDCMNRKGWISYSIQIPSRDVFVLELTGGGVLPSTNSCTYNLELEIAGVRCKAPLLTIPTGQQQGKTRFYLPMLSAGNYTAKLIWDNIDQDKLLRIHGMQLLSLDGPDNDGNGRKDWVDHRLMMMQKCNIPATSLTSPLCLEGNSGIALPAITITAVAGTKSAYVDFEGNVFWLNAGDQRIVTENLQPVLADIHDSIQDNFYSNVELSPEDITTVTVNRDGQITSQNVSWAPTNVLSVSEISVRRNDALLLQADNNSPGQTIVTIGDIQLTFNGSNEKIPYRFKEKGTYSVVAEFTSQTGETSTHQMTVNVVEAAFTGIPYSIVGFERNWVNANIPQEAVLEYDDFISVFRSNSGTGTNISFYGKKSGWANIIARLGAGGPIMAATQINIVDSSTHKADGYYKVIDTFYDGSKLIEGKIILSEVPVDLKIRLSIHTTGTMFLDGTLVKELTASDFDENGVCRYQMLKVQGAPTSTCHGIVFYQGNTSLFSYKN